MSVSHSGPWEITFCDLLKCFQCPTGVRESFFPKLALSGSLPPAVISQKEEVCRAVSLCPVKHGILGILCPRTNLSWQRQIKCPSSNGILFFSCCCSWDDVIIGSLTAGAVHHSKGKSVKNNNSKTLIKK